MFIICYIRHTMQYSRYINPKLSGVIVKEAVKCGKDNCRCGKGEMHKWYYYLYYRVFENGAWKLKKEYIKSDKVKYLKRKIHKSKQNNRLIHSKFLSNLSILNSTNSFVQGKLSVNELLKSIYEIA